MRDITRNKVIPRTELNKKCPIKFVTRGWIVLASQEVSFSRKSILKIRYVRLQSNITWSIRLFINSACGGCF